MVEIRFDKKFKTVFSKLKDISLKQKVTKQIKKISKNPEVGKPMRNIRKGTRELYVNPFRLSYSYYISLNVVFVLDLYHKKRQ